MKILLTLLLSLNIYADVYHVMSSLTTHELHGDTINHYKIGEYPKPYKNFSTYKKPTLFFELKNKDYDIKLSKHFHLKSFVCKQASKYPKYLTLKPSLILVLEQIITELNKEGLNISKVTIMSGYRTPHYNKIIGSSTNSRHIYGDAADIYIDQNGDGYFDDLNQDGTINSLDIKYLAKKVNLSLKKLLFKGGVGIYKRTSHHPMFVHVDTRGYSARWDLTKSTKP